MHPDKLSIHDFSYQLPEDKIARFPLPQRDQSKLLVFKDDEIVTSDFLQLDKFLPRDTLLVFNDTKVVEARLLFQKSTGGIIEIFCLQPANQYPDITSAMLQKETVKWKCLIGGASKWKHGLVLEKKVKAGDLNVTLRAAIQERLANSFIIEFSWSPAFFTFADILHHAGQIPLPPYLNREAEEIDRERYQTVYASQEGSVAAPTAGLHFTPDVLQKIEGKNIASAFVTLHVGAGTFKPVTSPHMAGHIMHDEFIDVTPSAIQKLISSLNKTIVPVGTTSLRTIESLYWMGVKLCNYPEESYHQVHTEDITITQWEPYELKGDITPQQALQALLKWINVHKLERLVCRTGILIAPGYTLRIAKAIITNFHQPQSTLLLLVSALVGNNWRKIYQYAIDHDFRFLSYGDSSLLFSAQEVKS